MHQGAKRRFTKVGIKAVHYNPQLCETVVSLPSVVSPSNSVVIKSPLHPCSTVKKIYKREKQTVKYFCGGLIENVPQRECTTRRYSLVGGSVSLWNGALRFHICSRYCPVTQFTSCYLKDIGHLATSLVPCLSACYYVVP